ncbi:MAG: DNA repair protein RecN [Fusobacteria bacterium]|nr:DNA repair protein RecN [Fusobacteriota bacterium]
MLKELNISNLAIIESASIEFHKGVTAITGETGAGKSIILEALELLMGKSAQTNLIRTGKESLVVEGVFNLSQKLVEKFQTILDSNETELIIRREIFTSKQNKVFINGRRATGTLLKEVFEDVVEVIGQHGNQLLFSEKNHLSLLDELLQDDEKKIKQAYKTQYKMYSDLQKHSLAEREKEKEARDKFDLFQYQLSELKGLKIKDFEEEKLNESYKILSNAEVIKGEIASIVDLFAGTGGVFANLKKGSRGLSKIVYLHKDFGKVLARIESLNLEFEDILNELEGMASSIEMDQSELDRVTIRLDELMKVKVKYRLEIPEIIFQMKEMERFIQNFSNSTAEITKSEKKLEAQKGVVETLASELTQLRKLSAKRLEERLVKELNNLGMPSTEIKVKFVPHEVLLPNGGESVIFLISPNKGESLKPMSEVLSGGEGSRVILALKTLFSENKGAEILILDEIDMGVGGKTVEKMAQVIKRLPQTQVLCITHSAPVAAIANQQLYIEKKEFESETKVEIYEVVGERRIQEIGRMIAGNSVTTQVLEHVKMLLECQ